MIMRESSAPYFWRHTARGIHDGSRSYNCGTFFGYINEDLRAAEEYVDSLLDKNVRGIVFAPLSMRTEAEYETYNAELVGRIRKTGIPLVLIDRRIKDRNVSSVISRDYEAACEITRRLLDAGVRKPVCLTHLYNSAFDDRIRGFRDTLSSRGYSDPESRVFDIAAGSLLFDTEDRASLARSIRALPSFDGVFTVNAANLFACVNGLGNKDGGAGSKKKYVNFDDTGFLHVEGLVASAVQRSHQIGYLAVRLLEEMIRENRNTVFSVIEDYEFRCPQDKP
jgi:DNA-binding LacI/PurR family transcriptional regulator